jgi:hypothetical protein
MKTTYGCALLTIVAASGGNVNAGLPGVNLNRAEPIIEDIGKFRTVCLDSKSLPPLESTHWNTRAWGFHELLLSTRCLVFLDQQVYWRCGYANWLEAFGFDSPNLRQLWTTSSSSDPKRVTIDKQNLEERRDEACTTQLQVLG